MEDQHLEIDRSSKNTDTQLGKTAFKAGVWYTISNIGVKATAIITTPLFTRLLSTSDYGISSTFSSWYTLLVVVFSLNLEPSVGRAKLDYPNDLGKYVGSIQTLSGIFSVALIAVSLLFIKPLSKFMELEYLALAVLGVYLVFSPAVILAQARYRYEYKYKENILILLYTTLFTALLSIALILLLKQDKWIGKIIGTAFPTVLLGAMFWIACAKRQELSFNKEYYRYALAISLPMIVHALSLNLLAQSDRVIITKYIGTEATGIYTLAYQYAILIQIIMNAINQAWQPWFHDNLFAGNEQLIKEKVKPLTILVCFVGLGCVSLAPEAIAILGPVEYRSGVWAVPPVVLGVYCQSLYSNYLNIELHLKKTKYLSYGTIIAAGVNLGLNILFVPRYGFVAAAYTTLFSYMLLFGIHYAITRFVLKVKLYDDWFFLLCFISISILSAGFMLLYEHFIIRFLAIFLIGVAFMFYNREILLSFIRNRSNKKTHR